MRLLHVFVIICLGVFLSGCRSTINKFGDFDPGAAVINGSISERDGNTEDLIYTGTAEVVRRSCPLTGKINLTIKPNGAFVMEVTTPTVGSQCAPENDFETAKVYGNGDENGVLRYTKCNQNETSPEGLGNYTLKEAAGGVSCFDLNAANKIEKWLAVTFNVKRVIEGKVAE